MLAYDRFCLVVVEATARYGELATLEMVERGCLLVDILVVNVTGNGDSDTVAICKDINTLCVGQRNSCEGVEWGWF